MTKAKENELRIESEIGRNVADYIFNKAREKVFTMKHEWYGGLAGKPMEAIGVVHSEEFLYLKDLQEICNQPPPIEKEMTAVELVEKLLKKAKAYTWPEKIKDEIQHLMLYQSLVELCQSLLKQNSEGKEGTEGGGK